MNSTISKFRTLFCAAMLSSMAVSSTHANFGFNQLINRIFSRVQPEQRKDWRKRLYELAKKMDVQVSGVEEAPFNWVMSFQPSSMSFPLSGRISISGQDIDLPQPQLDFIIAHELGHLSHWHSFMAAKLLTHTTLLGMGGVVVKNLWYDKKLPSLRKLTAVLLTLSVTVKWVSRKDEYAADAGAARALQSKQGGIEYFRRVALRRGSSPDIREIIGFVWTTMALALPFDWCIERFVTKNLERKLMEGYEELDENQKRVRDRVVRATKVASWFLSKLASLRVAGIIANRLRRGGLLLNASPHPTPQQRIDALKRLNLS